MINIHKDNTKARVVKFTAEAEATIYLQFSDIDEPHEEKYNKNLRTSSA